MGLGVTNVGLVRVATMIVVMVCVFALMANAQCEGDISGLISECAKYVMKAGKQSPPSSECCTVVKKSDIPCLCKYVTKDIEQYVSVKKAVYVAQYCGLALQHGSKCGSYTIPSQ